MHITAPVTHTQRLLADEKVRAVFCTYLCNLIVHFLLPFVCLAQCVGRQVIIAGYQPAWGSIYTYTVLLQLALTASPKSTRDGATVFIIV